MRNLTNSFRIIVLLFVLAACGAGKYPMEGYSTPDHENAAPNYSDLYYWAAHPHKYDLSDSIPKPYRNVEKDSTVDVFFLHPTTYTEDDSINGKTLTTAFWNASVQDAAINAKTDFTSMLNQASAFNKYRVFSPRYRQAHIKSFSLPDSVSKEFFDTAYADIKNAFEYYLKNFNGGRPFIIAAHSQGTLHAGRLIKEKIEGTSLQNRLVTAYIIGLAVPESYFSKLPPCTNPNQTGCFVSWRTYRQGYVPERVAAETFSSIVVNPVSWTTDTILIPRSMHQGALLYKFNVAKPHNVSTQIHGNVLWSSKPRFFGNLFFTQKNYHIGDINLFWKDIRDNADQRVRLFWKR
jgi:hypothetical protein